MRERPRTWQQAERRALVADLVRTQSILQARSAQLQEIFASRWYRLARFAWRVRRGSLFRKSNPPRMAGEDSYVRSLSGTDPQAEEPEVRLVPTLGEGGGASELERRRWLAEARMPSLEELRVAAILDEVSEVCLAPECDLDTGFSPEDWHERLEARPPHLLLVESAWTGNGGAWSGCVSAHPGSPQDGLPALRELLGWCRQHGIPTAFWATQDPVAFDSFAEAATLFDHLFTIDADCAASYRQLPNIAARTISVLPLAAQPRLHNPIAASGEPDQSPAFAGPIEQAWQQGDCEGLETLLDAARPHGLAIYNQGAKANAEGTELPTRFHPHVAGRCSYEEMVRTYKRHQVFLCANPSANSPTALSRQVFELLACGTPVLSTPSAAIGEIFGELLPVAEDSQAATNQLERLLSDDDYRHRVAELGQRQVLGAHTYRDRLTELTTTIGFDLPPSASEETTALVAVSAVDELSEAVDSLLAQSAAPNEVLVGLLDGATADHDLDRLATQLPQARIRTLSQEDDANHSTRLRELARLASAQWVAPIAATLRYGPNHLRDLTVCTRFADAQVIGFPAPSTERENGAHRYTDAVPPHAALASRDLVAARGWPRDEAEMRDWFAQGVRIYAGDPRGGALGAAE